MPIAKSIGSIRIGPNYTGSVPTAIYDNVFRALGYHPVQKLDTSSLEAMTDLQICRR